MSHKTFYSLLITLCILTSCNNDKAVPITINPDKFKEPMVKANNHMVKVETEDINNYISRHEWNMLTTGTGLKYMIYKNGQGIQAKSGDIVKINFNVNLINGIECYSSKEKGPLEFVTGKAEVINGLEEAILLMKEGDKAKAIIPSHLAYGLLGDDDRIPKRATLIYDIEVLKIVKGKKILEEK